MLIIVLALAGAATIFAIRDRRKPVTVTWRSDNDLYARVIAARGVRHAG